MEYRARAQFEAYGAGVDVASAWSRISVLSAALCDVGFCDIFDISAYQWTHIALFYVFIG